MFLRRKCTEPDRHQIDTPTAQNCCLKRQFFHAVGKEKRGERGEKRGERRKRKRGKERREEEEERERTVNRKMLDLIMFNSIIMLFYLLFHSQAKF